MNFEKAAAILGDDFIAPEEVSAKRCTVYDDNHMHNFTVTVPTENTLRWCLDNGFVVIPGPATWLSVMAIRDLDNSLFFRGRDWYRTEQFAQKDMAALGQWSVFRKGPVPDTLNKTWYDSLKQLPAAERCVTAGEAAWAFTTYRTIRGKPLVQEFCIRTNSVASNGDRVYIGYDGPDGLNIWHYTDLDRYPTVGLGSVLRS